jgi:multiple sugar transport system substrate-binding protein
MQLGRRSVAALGAAVLVAGFLAGCGSGSQSGGSDTTITLQHGYTDVEAKALTAQVKEWNGSHPDARVKLVFNGGNDSALQKTVAAFTAGNYPDVSYQYGSSAATLARQPKLVDLTDVAAAKDFDWQDFYPSERAAATVHGKVVGVPALVDDLSLVYNKKLFAAAGVPPPTSSWTWQDFRSAAARLTDRSSKTYGWAYVNDGSEDTVWRYLALLWQAGGELLSSGDTKPAFDSPAGQAALDLLQQMAVTDRSVYLDNGNGNYLNLFNSGKVAMLWTGPWDLSSIDPAIHYGVSILPGKAGNHETVSGPDLYLAFDRSEARSKNAVAFISWLTSPKVHLDFAIATGDLPVRRSESRLPAYRTFLAKYPSNKVFVQNLDNVKHVRPNIAQYPEVSTTLGQMVQSVLLGQAKPKEALDAARDQVTSALAGQ